MLVKRKPKPLLFVLITIFVFIICIGATWWHFTGPVDSGNKEDVEVVVTSGMSTGQIGEMLKEKDLIYSVRFFKVYVKIHHVVSLKASKYVLHKNMSLGEIVRTLEKGSNYNPDRIKLTFKEGLRITDYAKVVEKGTNHSSLEYFQIMNDSSYIKTLIEKYWFLTDSILDSNIYYPLEGYLAPDTYYFDNKDVSITSIIETMLDEMEEKLEKYKDGLLKDPHYYLTMASIIELEGTNLDNRKMIAGIFENRLHSGMNLGSDVTTYYGLQAAMTSDLSSEQFASVNFYNTRSSTMIGKMPIGPICNPSILSVEASVNPTPSDYLFFVADKNGKIYYTKKKKKNDQKVAEIKKNGDWIW